MNTYMNDGVGKRIVDALKQQTEIGFNQPTEQVDEIDSIMNNTATATLPDNDVQTSFQQQASFVSQSAPVQNSGVNQTNMSMGMNFNSNIGSDSNMFSQNTVSDFGVQNVPANVMILKQLVSQLPSGVSRQAGALVIKQTMEALGISMNTVLHEAQKVQDAMNESIKNCMLSIQEYKNNIKNLEKQGLDYQRQVNQLNDLISLFILTDKD